MDNIEIHKPFVPQSKSREYQKMERFLARMRKAWERTIENADAFEFDAYCEINDDRVFFNVEINRRKR